MEDLLPGGTVVLANTVDGPVAGHWSVNCPVLVLNRIQRAGLKQQVVRAIARRFGWQIAELGVFLVYLSHRRIATGGRTGT